MVERKENGRGQVNRGELFALYACVCEIATRVLNKGIIEKIFNYKYSPYFLLSLKLLLDHVSYRNVDREFKIPMPVL